jgi:hypothetical protein
LKSAVAWLNLDPLRERAAVGVAALLARTVGAAVVRRTVASADDVAGHGAAARGDGEEGDDGEGR